MKPRTFVIIGIVMLAAAVAILISAMPGIDLWPIPISVTGIRAYLTVNAAVFLTATVLKLRNVLKK